eukprot:s4550_g5.t1
MRALGNHELSNIFIQNSRPIFKGAQHAMDRANEGHQTDCRAGTQRSRDHHRTEIESENGEELADTDRLASFLGLFFEPALIHHTAVIRPHCVAPHLKTTKPGAALTFQSHLEP